MDTARRRFLALCAFVAFAPLPSTAAAHESRSSWLRWCFGRMADINAERRRRGAPPSSFDVSSQSCEDAYRDIADDRSRREYINSRRNPNNDPNVFDDCFITSACCGCVGLPDDCAELATLRQFRDRVLVHTPGGPADIALYRHTAPLILARMRQGGDAAELLRLYWCAIVPAVVCVRLGFYRAARALYTRMMCRLMARYGIVDCAAQLAESEPNDEALPVP